LVRFALQLVRRFASDTHGAASMEFAVVFPFFVILLFMSGEVGVLAGRTVLFKRGVDIAAREVRLGFNPGADVEQFKRTVCAYAFLINTCEQDLKVEMVRINSTIGQDRGAVVCRNRVDPDLEPVTTYTRGKTDDIILIRACLIVDPVFPGTGLGASLARTELGGGYAIVALNAFMNE